MHYCTLASIHTLAFNLSRTSRRTHCSSLPPSISFSAHSNNNLSPIKRSRLPLSRVACSSTSRASTGVCSVPVCELLEGRRSGGRTSARSAFVRLERAGREKSQSSGWIKQLSGSFSACIVAWKVVVLELLTGRRRTYTVLVDLKEARWVSLFSKSRVVFQYPMLIVCTVLI